MSARYLIDKSALSRMTLEPVKERLAPIIEAGEAATCAIVDLEVLYSARNHEEHERIRRRRALAYASAPITDETFERAVEIQGELARIGRHRVPIPDLIIAQNAVQNELEILASDKHFALISRHVPLSVHAM